MPISVLVVDDSVVVRRLVTTALQSDPELRVVATAANGRIALAKLGQVAPDLVTLDIEMPELDGLATLVELRKTHPRLPVVMFSTLTERAATATLEALALGANDYVTKPANVGSVSAAMDAVRTQLVPKIKVLCGRPVAPLRPSPATATTITGTAAAAARPRPSTGLPTAPTAPRTLPRAGIRTPQVLAIGCSTGGPEALGAILRALPADLPVPVVVVQHMPPVFTAMFAQRLDSSCALKVSEARHGDPLLPGRVLLAPGDLHMRLGRRGGRTVVDLDQGPAVNWCRPAVDPLFASVAETYGAASLAVVLTGMGQDGLRGAERLRLLGAEVLVQDQATSVVWGMPGSIAAAGFATRVVPLPAMASAITAALRPGAGTAPGRQLLGTPR